MKVLSHKRKTLEECEQEIDSWTLSPSEKKHLKKFLVEYISGRITKKRASNIDGLSESLTSILKIPLMNINDLSSQNEIKKFYDKLLSDKITPKRYKDQTYSLKYKAEIIHTLKRYLLWRFPDKLILSALLDISISFKKKEPDFLSLNELEILYKHCKNNKERYIIAGLFSTGARIEEFMNLRFCDYELNGNFPKVTIRESTSKTKGRTISLYWTHCLEAISSYMIEQKKLDKKDTDFILNITYSSIVKWLTRHQKKCKLNKKIHAHLFRDSCATWLASKLNRQQLCVYFGWAFSSNMPDRYISRAGVNMQEIDTKIKNENLDELRTELDKKIFDRDLQIEELKNRIDSIVKIVQSNITLIKETKALIPKKT